LLVHVNDALPILHNTTVKPRHLALSTRKLRFKKAVHKLKYCIKKAYKLEVKSSASTLDENNKDFYVCFVPCWKNCKKYTKDPLLVWIMFKF